MTDSASLLPVVPALGRLLTAEAFQRLEVGSDDASCPR
jgi:hypothetical protein